MTEMRIVAPSPKNRIASGIMATDGTGRKNSTMIFSASNTGLYVPIRIPTTIATTVARARPRTYTESVTPIWLEMSPLISPWKSAANTAVGGGT